MGITTVVVTHNMESAYSIADRIAMMHDGVILAEGTPEKIRRMKQKDVYQFVRGIS